MWWQLIIIVLVSLIIGVLIGQDSIRSALLRDGWLVYRFDNPKDGRKYTVIDLKEIGKL
jgi:hypothetical protein